MKQITGAITLGKLQKARNALARKERAKIRPYKSQSLRCFWAELKKDPKKLEAYLETHRKNISIGNERAWKDPEKRKNMLRSHAASARTRGQSQSETNRKKFERKLSKNWRKATPIQRTRALTGPTPEEIERLVEQKQMLARGQEGLNYALAQLNPKEREIIERQYGLNGKPKETFREMQNYFKISYAALNMTYHKALKKLRKILSQ